MHTTHPLRSAARPFLLAMLLSALAGASLAGAAPPPADIPTAPAATLAAQVRVSLVSVSSGGVQGNGESFASAMSADGRFIAFSSRANNLVPGDPGGVTNSSNDIFVHDRITRLTSVVSVSSSGEWANERSFTPSISADGRFVAFESQASNLVPNDTNVDTNGRPLSDIFVHDRLTGTTTRVSVASDGTQSNDTSSEPAISGDGRYVAFTSFASNLVSGDTNGQYEVFVHDRLTRATTRVSVASDGSQSTVACANPAINADGRYVVFECYDDGNLVPGDTNQSPDIFLHDRATRQTTRVSVLASGSETFGTSLNPAISADGRYIAFDSTARLVPTDNNGATDVFVRDQLTGAISLVSVTSAGTQTRGNSSGPAISANGRYIGFGSYARLTDDPLNMGSPVGYLHDRTTRQTILTSITPGGAQANGSAGVDAVSDDGRFVAFTSTANDLVPDDRLNTPGQESDIFLAEVLDASQVTPALVTNHADGAPGSSFLLTGTGFPAGGSVQLSVNGTAVGSALTADSAGRFTALIQTDSAAAPGYYVILARANSAAGLAQAGTVTDLVGYRLIAPDSGAVVRQPPAGVTAPTLAVPAGLPAHAALPLVYMPSVVR